MTLLPLPVAFYNRSVLEVARDLLGQRLVREIDGQRVAGYITETEAYQGESDLACHARAGLTARNEVLYGPPGRAYVYFIYGVHWMLNCVAEPDHQPAAALIRAMVPSEGLSYIVERRKGARQQDWTNGPAKICQALDIDSAFNGADLTSPQEHLWVEPGYAVPETSIITGPRVGIANVPEPWRSIPWRFRVDLKAWNLPPDAIQMIGEEQP